MIKTRQSQSGLSMIQVIFLIAVFGFIGLFGIKVGPSYIEYLTVAKIADDVAGNADLMKKPKSKVFQAIDKAYRTNNLWDLAARDTIILEKDRDKGYLVKVHYEKRANLFSNIHVVTAFDKTVGTP